MEFLLLWNGEYFPLGWEFFSMAFIRKNKFDDGFGKPKSLISKPIWKIKLPEDFALTMLL